MTRRCICIIAIATGMTFAISAGTFAPTGSMSAARAAVSAIPLPNGKVFVCCGTYAFDSGPRFVSGVELYDPATGMFTFAAEVPGGIYNATLLTNGKVFLTGYSQTSYGRTAAAFLYDIVSGTIAPTGTTAVPREAPAAALPDGSVMVFGGASSPPGPMSTEIYDPATGAFHTGPMMIAPVDGLATPLSDGRILLTGSYPQIFDPAAGKFITTGHMATASAQLQVEHKAHSLFVQPNASSPPFVPDSSLAEHAATLLPNGKVLITGGVLGSVMWVGTDRSSGCPQLYMSARAQIFDPASNSFAFTGWMETGVAAAAASVMLDGRVLVTGGYYDECYATYIHGEPYYSRYQRKRYPQPTAEIYDPVSGLFTSAGSMTEPRYSHSAATLATGQVLLIGGLSGSAVMYSPAYGMIDTLRTAEIFSSTDPVFQASPSPGPLKIAGTGSNILVENTGPAGNALTVKQVSLSSGFTATGLPIENLAPGSSSTFSIRCGSGSGSGTLVVATNEKSSKQYAYELTCSTAVARLILSAPFSATIGVPVSFNVTAVDEGGARAADYSGVMRFASSDPFASLPSNASLTNGAGSFSATFHTAGSTKLTVADVAQPAVNASVDVVVSLPAEIPALSQALLLALGIALLAAAASRL